MNASCARCRQAEGTSAWASRIASPPPTARAGRRMLASRAARRGRPKCEPPARDVTASGGRRPRLDSRRAASPAVPSGSPTLGRAPRPPDGRREPRPRPQVRRDHPLSLSISISGGKETNEDSPSNGERTGNSPSLESGGPAVRIVAWRSVLSDGPGPSPLEWGTGEGDSPVVPGPCRTTRRCRRVGLFGNAAPIGR